MAGDPYGCYRTTNRINSVAYACNAIESLNCGKNQQSIENYCAAKNRQRSLAIFLLGHIFPIGLKHLDLKRLPLRF